MSWGIDTILSLPIHKHGISFHLFRSPLVSLNEALKVFLSEVLTFCSSGPVKMPKPLLRLSVESQRLADMHLAKWQTHIIGFLFLCRSWLGNLTLFLAF